MRGKSQSALDRWTPEAKTLSSDEKRLSTPLHVLLGEAVDIAKFYKKYYDSVPDAKGAAGRPGLDSVEGKKPGLHAGTAEDILSIREAVQEAQTAFLLAASPKVAAPMERGQFLLNEIVSTLEWHFDDGVEDEKDSQLKAVEQAHADDPETPDAMASALDDYAALGNLYRQEIDGLGGFDAALLDEAAKVAEDLRAHPAEPVPLSDEAKTAKALRNRMAMLLSGRVSLVRGTARFVFRNQPDIVREATSAYERRRRAAARRATAKKAVGAADTQPLPAVLPAKPA